MKFQSDSRLGEYTTILGVCASVNCPLCMTMRRFRLLHINDGLTKGGFYAVSCDACGSTRDIPATEEDGAREAMELYGRFQGKEINAAEYGSALLTLSFFNFLSEIHSEGESWRCAACQEKCPGNFVECWNCQAVRPGYDGSVEAPLDAEPPELPRTSIVNHPDKPWEG
jgi:hypothetical protein